MRKTTAVAMGIVLLFASAACGGGGPTGPQTYRVTADAATPDAKNFQYSTFFPSTLKASPGDTVIFDNASKQAPHTITFGVEADRSNQPPVLLEDGTESPVVVEPCFAADGPTNTLTKCPSKTLPAYDGSGFWSSGFLVPAPAPEGPKNVTLKLADSIEPGQYPYLCVLHGPMTGVLEVVDEGDRATTDEVIKIGLEEAMEVQEEANDIDDPAPGPNTIAAGWSGGVTAVNRFLPETLEVKAGTPVSWESFSEYEPHTVSFGPDFKAGVPGPGQMPSGPENGGEYSGGSASSGMFGKAGGPFPGGPYELTFTEPGTYDYVCVLHPNMTGSVKVT